MIFLSFKLELLLNLILTKFILINNKLKLYIFKSFLIIFSKIIFKYLKIKTISLFYINLK